MLVVLKHGGATYNIELGLDSSLNDLQQAVEAATGVIARRQKLLCKGKVLTALPSSTPLTELQFLNVQGAKVMLLSAAVESQGLLL